VRQWAHEFGGRVLAARTGEATFPVAWEQRGAGSLGALSPDIVVLAGDTTFIFDAKYKGHLEELDDSRWREIGESIQAEHRHDFHQVLAYTALFDTPRIVTVLVYPLFLSTWESSTARGNAVKRARVLSGSRQVEVGLTGVPLQLRPGLGAEDLARQFHVLRAAL